MKKLCLIIILLSATFSMAEHAKTRVDAISSMIFICAAHNGIYPNYAQDDGGRDFLAENGKTFNQAIRRASFHSQFQIIMLTWAGCIHAHNGNEKWKHLTELKNLGLSEVYDAVYGRYGKYGNVKELALKLMELNGDHQ